MLWKTILFSLASAKLLRVSSMLLMAGDFTAADLRTMNWKPSLETRMTELLFRWSVMVEKRRKSMVELLGYLVLM